MCQALKIWKVRQNCSIWQKFSLWSQTLTIPESIVLSKDCKILQRTSESTTVNEYFITFKNITLISKGCFLKVYSTKGDRLLNFSGVFAGKELPKFKKFGHFENRKFWRFWNRQLCINRTIFDGFLVILAKRTWSFLEQH